MSSIEKVMEKLAQAGQLQTRQPGGESGVATIEEMPSSSAAVESDGDPRVPEGEEEAQTGGALPLIKLDFQQLQLKGYLTPISSATVLAEEYRRLKRPIMRNAFGKGAVSVEYGNLVMVTSALPGEGKTFTALNLALSLAMERDTTVLMLDCDLVNPSLSRILGLADRPGLTDVLQDSGVEIQDVMFRTNFSKLRVVPAGQPHPQATELLTSEKMHRISAEFSRRYPDRIVLFDAPPLLLSTQAAALSNFVGQVLVVVEAGSTEQRMIKEAISLLDEDKVVGMVLNKARRQLGGGYYGAYYGNS